MVTAKTRAPRTPKTVNPDGKDYCLMSPRFFLPVQTEDGSMSLKPLDADANGAVQLFIPVGDDERFESTDATKRYAEGADGSSFIVMKVCALLTRQEQVKVTLTEAERFPQKPVASNGKPS